MADLGWLRSSSSVKIPSTIGSLAGSSASSVFNGSNENLFDLLQGRLGGSGGGGGTSIFGTSSADPNSFSSQSDPHPDQHDRDQDQDQQAVDAMDSGSLLKTEDENHLQSTVEQMAMGIQPNVHLWPISDTTTSPLLGAANTSHHQEMLFNTLHTTPPLPGPAALVLDSCQFPSLPSLKTHDPAPQLQALREFMSFGSSCTPLGNGVPQLHSSGSLGGHGGSSMFLHLGDESCGGAGPSSLLQLPGLPTQVPRRFVGENSSGLGGSGKSGADLMAYRSLCQTELFGTERSPHRTQFQRENHILAERQRREEMNEKFSALRAMIPKATKKDKASIVGDTIGYVLELQKTLKHLQACKANRKGHLKLPKNKPSSSPKMGSSSAAAATTATTMAADDDDDGDRSIVNADSSPADLDSSNVAPMASGSGGASDALKDDPQNGEAAGSGSGVMSNLDQTDVFPIDGDLDPDHGRAAGKKIVMEKEEPEEMDIFDHDPMISCSSGAEDVNACADSFEHQLKDEEALDVLPASTSGSGGHCNVHSEVDVQNLGEQQAVIKIVCARSSGLVLRILCALDECKVDVLQSNVTTVAEKSVHFITVQISSGLSSTTEEMIAVLLKASSSTDSNGRS